MLSKKSLLERAKEVKIGKRKPTNFTDDKLELIVAWFNDEVSLTQLSQVMGFSSTNQAYSFVALGARQIWRITHEGKSKKEKA